MSFYGSGREYDMLQDALEAGGIAWWMMDYPSGAVFFGENKLKMLGYNESDMGKFVHFTHFTDLIHPDDYEGAMHAMRNLLTGKSDQYETRYRIRKKDGDYIVYYDKGRVVGRNNKGEIAIAGVVVNVTESTLESMGLPTGPTIIAPTPA